MTTFENDAILYADSNRGVYIPQHFAESVKRECIEGVDSDDWAILEFGPDHEWYWETWELVLNNAVLHNPDNKIAYQLHHDGDLWLVPDDCEIPEW